MVNVLIHVPRFLRQWLFDEISREVNSIEHSVVALDFVAIRDYILARLAALFHL